MDQRELDINRDLTNLFIGARPSTVVMTPYARVQQANGQYKQVAQPARFPQTVRVVELAPAVATSTRIVLDDGTERRVDYTIIAPYNAVIAVGDRFTFQGDPMEVLQVDSTNGYEVRAAVVRRLSP